MSKHGYPESLNCWLRDYPRFIKVIFGPEMENLDGPWGNGSVVYLERIGFDAPDTSPTIGVAPPDVKVTYSDNGTDVDWVFKIGMYGWGSFFATTGGANYYVDIEKWLEFESIYFDLKKFRLRNVVETQIPKTTEIPNVVVPERIIYVPPSGEPPPDPVVPPPISTYWDSAARALVSYYQTLLNLDTIDTVTATVTKTSNTGVVGRQIGPTTSCGGSTCTFYIFGSQIFLVLNHLSVNCEDFILGEPINCSYSLDFAESYVFNSLYVNSLNRLQELVNRV